MKPKAQKVYVTYVIVQGRGEFPYDMLRYDACCPDKESDTSRMGRPDEVESFRHVTLRRYSVSGMPVTERRWRSFGWDVVLETADSLEASEQVRRLERLAEQRKAAVHA